jgi:hypothetical protein
LFLSALVKESFEVQVGLHELLGEHTHILTWEDVSPGSEQ